MEASNSASPTNHHIVAVTLPLHGHAIRLMRLSMKLASMGFTITFISTHSQLKSLRQEAAAFISTNMIEFASLEDFNLKEHRMQQCVNAMACKIPEIDELLQSAEMRVSSQVCCILSDFMLLPFLAPIRHKRPHCQVVAVAVGCASFNLLDKHLGKRTDDGGINFSALPAIIPDFPTRLSLEDIPFAFLTKTTTSAFHESLSKSLEQANWFIINTFEELEDYALNALRQTYKLPVLSLGPLHIFKGLEKGVEEEELEEDHINNSSIVLRWLSTKQPSSVIYISFGTLANLSMSNMQELAMGLEATNFNFLWVIRSTSLLQLLPSGFIERTSNRGLIVDWCPQLRVLKHLSIGAFLTHGGWNSVLEAISYGVPMLGWPHIAEQNLNCKLLADVWKFGNRINNVSEKLDGTTRMVGREEIEVAIKTIMKDARSNGKMKARAVEFQEKAMRAIAEKGSSNSNFLQLVNSLKKNKIQ